MPVLHDATAASTADAAASARRETGYQAYPMLRFAFGGTPIAFGPDRFFKVLTDWPRYLAAWVDDLGLLLAAATLTRLALVYDRPRS